MSLPPTCLWPWESHFLSLKIHYYSCLLPPYIHLLPPARAQYSTSAIIPKELPSCLSPAIL